MQHQKQVTKEFNERIPSIRAMLKRLSKASEKHFAIDPDKANWADLGEIIRIEIALKQLSDQVFQEGEYAYRDADDPSSRDA